MQLAQWNEQWARKQERERKAREREAAQKLAAKEKANAQAYLLSRQKEADARQSEAEDVQHQLNNLVISAASLPELDFESLKNHVPFSKRPPAQPKLQSIPPAPDRGDSIYNPKPGFATKLSSRKMLLFQQENEAHFQRDFESWRQLSASINSQNNEIMANYNKAQAAWHNEKEHYEKQQAAHNSEIDQFREQFLKKDTATVEQYVSMQLERVHLPFDFDAEIICEYQADNKLLIVDALFPAKEQIPAVKSVSYVKSKDEIRESFLSDSAAKKLYDHVMYSLVLAYLSQIFSIGDKYDLFNAAAINGKVRTIDRSTGNEIEPYVLSIHVSKEDFSKLNLQAIDPRAWFKSAKGVSAATFANVTPVAPVIMMNKEDHRFIDAYSVMDEVNEGTNLAAMDWQDFENLIREVFEQEFSVNGGEVKITQASRDGGVDAIAFDPDPIRGGKIVIQAKRYTNVVGVSAVRDLYGTVMNEGAIKGILVTTSNYGNDAYAFAKDKPLTLLNGANLLSLLERNGHKAYINISEAKKILNEASK